MQPAQILSQSFTLPNGTILQNRLVKSAMSEALGTVDNRPTSFLETLYGRWSAGGVGLCISGNVMIDCRALGESRNVVIENASDLDLLEQWAVAGNRQVTQLWMQINHPGKQAPRGLNCETVSPSAIPFRSDLGRFFDTPRELREEEIEDIILRFGRTAHIAQAAGFKGVQIHGAHGYLVSQFLSPHHNRRDDRWGGNAVNRRRFMLEVLSEIRRQVGKTFPIGIKLNSADFQRGGFAEEESIEAIQALENEGIDLVEISGGTYEAPVMVASGKIKESTQQREAYFLKFAEKARAATRVPLMVTGGFRTAEGMASAIASGAVDLIGLARPLAVEPDLPMRLLAGLKAKHVLKPIETGIKSIDKNSGFMEIAWYNRQLQVMGRGKNSNIYYSPLKIFLMHGLSLGWKSIKRRLFYWRR